MPDFELDDIVRDIKSQHPFSGYALIVVCLKAKELIFRGIGSVKASGELIQLELVQGGIKQYRGDFTM